VADVGFHDGDGKGDGRVIVVDSVDVDNVALSVRDTVVVVVGPELPDGVILRFVLVNANSTPSELFLQHFSPILSFATCLSIREESWRFLLIVVSLLACLCTIRRKEENPL